MKKTGLVLIGLLVLAVLSAGCTQKGIILNLSSNNTTSNTTSSSNSPVLENVSNISDGNLTNITEPHDPGVPEEPNQSTN